MEDSNQSKEIEDSNQSKKTLDKWKRSANLIWQKFVDHRAGNLFLKTIKDSHYTAVIKEPMSLELIKARIRDGVIGFHVDDQDH